MRPDKHKQKQSAKYKKSHGIKQHGDSDNHEAEGRGHKKGSHTTVTRHSHGSRTAATGSSAAPAKPNMGKLKHGHTGASNRLVGGLSVHRSCGSDPEFQSDSEEDCVSTQSQDVSQKPTFRKRQVVSNWEQYSGLDESIRETDSLRGADFKSLLDAAGSALSQFRFDEERAWDGGEVEAGNADSDTLLSVNCTTLAAALSCIPLPDRLNIDYNLFQSHQIEEFHQDARRNQVTYKEVLSSHQNSSVQQNPVENAVPSLSSTSTSKIPIETDSSHVQDGSSVLDEILGTGTAQDSVVYNHDDTSVTAQTSGQASCVGPDELSVLDDILSMDKAADPAVSGTDMTDFVSSEHVTNRDVAASPGLDANGDIQEVTASVPGKAPAVVLTGDIEAQLDMLLALDDDDDDDSQQNQQLQPATTAADSSVAAPNVLEDWLDSVLGD